MTTQELINRIKDRSGLPKAVVDTVLAVYAQTAMEVLNETGEVPLPHLGKFSKKEKAARQGRNPGTGDVITIPAHAVVKFQAGKSFKEAVA